MSLDVKHLFVRRGNKNIVTDISLHIPDASIVGLLGPNGAGKTTSMQAICGLTRHSDHTETTISLNQDLLTHASLRERVDCGLVYLPQNTSLFSSLTVTDNLRIIFDYHPHWSKCAHAEFLAERDRLLERTGLSTTINQLAYSLSGGQKRKLEVVRTLLMHPKVIVCDEPFAGVDPKSISELKQLFRTIVTEQQISVVISDHNVDQLLTCTDYVYVILQGSVVAQGTVSDILKDEKTKSEYFGEEFHLSLQKRLKE